MFKKIFIDLCNKNKESPSSVCKKVGIAPATFSCWTDDSVPRRATLQRIADYFGVTVNYLLGAEQEKKAYTAAEKSNLIPLSQNNVYSIPVVENVSAGFGSLAINDIVDYMPLYFTSEYEAQETICIKVKGDSMFPKIEDGDIIQVHKQTSVDSGSIAVVLLDEDEGLVKKVVYGPDWIELHSINPMYPVQRFEGRNVLRLRVVGLVKKIIKSV